MNTATSCIMKDELLHERAIHGHMTGKEFLYRLFFTRDDALDVLQILFIVIVIVTLFLVGYITLTPAISDVARVEGLVTLRWLIGLLVATAVPKWLIPAVSRVPLPQTIIQQSPAPEPPHLMIEGEDAPVIR